MLRRLRSAAVLISFIAFVGLITVWVRSYWVAESNWWRQIRVAGTDAAKRDPPRGAVIGVGSDSGYVTVGWMVPRVDDTTTTLVGWWEHSYTREMEEQATARPDIWEGLETWGRFGFHYVNMGVRTGDVYVLLVIPYWALTLLSAVVPGVWLIRFLRSRRRLAGGFPVEVTPIAMPQSGGVR